MKLDSSRDREGSEALTRRGLLRAAGLGAGALYLAGCGTSQELPSSRERVQVQAGVPGPNANGGEAGGLITIGWESEGNSLDPAIGYDLTSWDAICNCITAPPLVFGANGEGPFPNAAAGLHVSPDNRVYTLRLRHGVRFQHGRVVTAHDYVYSWERVLSRKLASWASSYLYPIEGAEEVFKGKATSIKGVTVIDPMTLRIELQQPDLTFPYILAQPYMAAVPREVVEHYGTDFPHHVVSTGPFTLASYSSDAQTCTFAANRHYLWRGLPYLDGISYRWGSSAQTELLQLEHDNIQSIGEGIGPSLVPQVFAETSLDKYVVTIPLPAVLWIGLNCKHEPFTDPRVRQALNWAVDRVQLGHITYGTGVPWGLPFPKTLPGFPRTATPYGYDPERAKSLLRAAGADSLSFTLTSTADDPNPSIAQVLQQQFDAVGVHMSIDTVSENAYNTATENKNFVAAPVHWYQVQPTALDIVTSNYTTGASSNYWNYSDAKVDALAKQAIQAPSKHRSDVYLARAEELVKQDAPGIFLEALNFVDGRSPNLENFHYNVFYGTYYDRLWTKA
jgi:peptide/nickel transport system substrate-binding protein